MSRRGAVGCLDALAFASLWVAAVAAALCAASSRALAIPPDPRVVALAALGTLAIYNLDRLRDLERDRLTSPLRSAFVSGHRRPLAALALAAALATLPLVVSLGPRVVVLLAPIALAGGLHRRLKRFPWTKPLYVAVAWTGVVVGLPAVTGHPSPRGLPWVAGVVGITLFANAIASNLRDGEAVTARLGARVPLRLARIGALAGLAGGLLAPPGVRPLALVPAALLLALGPFRAEERYGLLVVDGALWLGGLAALPLF